MMDTSMTATLRAILILLTVTLQLRYSDGTQRARNSASRDIRGTEANSSTLDNAGAPPSQSACQKTRVDISISPPRPGCSQGVMKDVPVCSGGCNSYMTFKLSYPYKQSQCSCCTATTYRTSRRTVSFQCGSTNETESYNIAAVVECNCTPCGSAVGISRPVVIP